MLKYCQLYQTIAPSKPSVIRLRITEGLSRGGKSEHRFVKLLVLQEKVAGNTRRVNNQRCEQ